MIGEPREGELGYEDFLASGDGDWEPEDVDERAAAVMCYTSGTTGQPKGVLYSHRALAIHSLAATQSGTLGISEKDTCLPVVPMFHANAWGFPFHSTLVGAKQVFPGPHLDPQSLLDAFEQERVTVTAGVPTIWLGILQLLDANPKGWDLSSVRGMIVGGSAAPRSMIEGFERRHGLKVIHAWGMTEMSPLGTVSELTADLEEADDETRFAYRAKQGAAGAVRRDPRARRGGPRPVGRADDGRARGARRLDRVRLLRRRVAGRPLDGRRLVQDRRHRHDRRARLHRDPGPLEGRDQVRRRVDLVRAHGERADGPSRPWPRRR